MKKVLFTLFLFMGSIAMCFADNVQEIVYLKNGSIIRGIVIEQVPGVSLKVQTSDGSVFSYPISEVEKITKEFSKSSTRNTPVSFMSYNNHSGNETGYKGFLDLGFTLGVGDYGEERLELSTSHGYQFNPYLYAGAGIALNYYTSAEVVGLPIFAHVRGNLFDNNISPYIDFRIGYSPLNDVKGFYMAPSIGCKINSFNVSIGYVMQKVSYEDYLLGYYYSYSENVGGFSIKIGYEF